MKSSKADPTKHKKKANTQCSSRRAYNFLEDSGYNGLTFNSNGLSASLNDFMPTNNEAAMKSNDLDFEMVKLMKKLDKKDLATKQKALMELNDLINKKNQDDVVNMLRFWPKLYNRLSVDEDKRVRELTQEMMSTLAKLCGKNLSPHLKEILPTWIFAQSDMHVPAADLATSSFENTFQGEDRQRKAYMLCWEDISKNIKLAFTRNPIITAKEDISVAKKDEIIDNCNEDEKKAEVVIQSRQTARDNSQFDIYATSLIRHLRTLTTLLPVIAECPDVIAELKDWLHSKVFWQHFKSNASPNIISIYLTFTTKLMVQFPEIVLEAPFIIGNVTQALRLIEIYNSGIVPLVWTAILKCSDILGENVWKHVSFTGSFLPKWLKMLECAVDGRMTLAGSFMLPFFTKMPVNFATVECVSVFTRIFDAMTASIHCPRVKNNSQEANCVVLTILECGTYTVLAARAHSNNQLKEKVLSVIWFILENYLSDIVYSKADKMLTHFCGVALRPLVNKHVISSSQFADILSIWINKYYINDIFSQNLAELLIELDQMDVTDETFCKTLFESVQSILIEKVVQKQAYLLPYLSILSSQRSITQTVDNRHQLKDVFLHCRDILAVYNPSVMNTIAVAMANVLNNLSEDADCLYDIFLSTLSIEQSQIFFENYYILFLKTINEQNMNTIITKTLSFWEVSLLKELNVTLRENGSEVPTFLTLVIKLCSICSAHNEHISPILRVLESFITKTTQTSVLHDYIDLVINILKFSIEELNRHFSMDLLSRPMILHFVQLLLSITKDAKVELTHLKLYLQRGSTIEAAVFRDILDEVLRGDSCEFEVAADIVEMCLREAPESIRTDIIGHISHTLLSNITSINTAIHKQKRYSHSIMHSQQHILITTMYRINVLLRLPFDCDSGLDDLKVSVTHCCVLITPVIINSFSNCHYSTNLLNQCESIYKFAESIVKADIIDLMLISSQSVDSNMPILDQCIDLVLLALKHFIAVNYSQWTHSVLSSVDLALGTWMDPNLSFNQLQLILEVLVPCAAKARYLVQEDILARISSLLSEDCNPTINDINRSIQLMKSLASTDSSFFPVCYPLLLSAKHRFQSNIDQLYDATVDESANSTQFDLSSLLELLITGVDSCSSALDHNHWDFILCIIGTLSRSSQFIDSGDFSLHTASSDSNTHDHVFNSVLLLRLIASVTVALASVNHETVLDEWDNFFSGQIFTTILDMFSLVSGDHTGGRLVTSELFVFYTEALAEVVSLCPVSILLGHNFHSQIHINDPVELPKEFILVFNSLLGSLSSYSQSTQLAAYNCLLNLTDNLSTLLLDQINKVEATESLESFSLTIPYKLLTYLQSDDLIQLTVDKIENEVVLTRCFLAWNVIFHLFACSQPNVRAEISSFLVEHDRLFDKFLSFCFTFMPKSPFVNKRNLTFLAVNGRQFCNLIADEPQVFSKCLERRTTFTIYHLASYVFRRAVQVLPNMARCWFLSLDVNSQQQVDSYVRQFITPELFKLEFEQLKQAVVHEFDERLEIHALPVIGEVTVRYIVPGDQCLEQVINVPNNYPIGKVAVDFKKEMKVKISHWKSWIIQMTSTMQNQNGSILDGVKLWKKNLDDHFDGVEECMICYSILHAIKYTLPTMKCRQCKKKFHKDCMYKWFQSSTNPTCPNCRNVFYDGTYKRSQYGDNDM